MSKTTDLVISSTLSLPVDAVTSTFGILAKKRAGKSNAAVKIAEEMYRVGVPWVAIDPKGDWYGMRSSGDGKKPGIPLVVFGGRHADVPLEPTAGVMLADLILAHRLTCILDVSEFSRADVVRFLTTFGDRLYKQATNEPMHLFLEEAHEYLPQQVRGEDARVVGVMQRIVKQGGFKGIGCTLISQRSASLNKDVLTQVDTLIVLRTTSPQDRAAVKAWVDVHVDAGKMMDELPSLADGVTWVWSPEFLGKLVKIQFHRRWTFDSGATPKVGETRRAPTAWADVDLDKIKTAMAATVEQAKANDPAELHAQIAALKKQLQSQPAVSPVVETREVEVIREIVPEGLIDAIQAAAAYHDDAAKRLHDLHLAVIERAARVPLGTASRIGTRDATSLTSPEAKKSALPQVTGSSGKHKVQFGSTSRSTNGPEINSGLLSGPQRRLLTVLATYGPRTKAQLAAQARYSVKSGSFSNTISSLRTAGWVLPGDPITISANGMVALGDYEPLPTGRDLLTHWLSTLNGPQRKILEAIIDIAAAIAGPISKDDLAQATGYSAGSGSFSNTISSLCTLCLIKRVDGGLMLVDEFAEAIQG